MPSLYMEDFILPHVFRETAYTTIMYKVIQSDYIG
jgi:hypothetical protein